MNDTEKIIAFSDMVNAAERLTKPWRIALLITNLFWCIVVTLLVCFAYLTPVEMEQGQQFTEQTQSQSYSEGAAHGD